MIVKLNESFNLVLLLIDMAIWQKLWQTTVSFFFEVGVHRVEMVNGSAVQ